MLNSILYKAVAVLLFATAVYPQRGTTRKDTSTEKATHSFLWNNGLTKRNPLLFIPGTDNLGNPDFKADPSRVWLITRLGLMNNGSNAAGKTKNFSDMLQPYYNFYIDSKNISLMRQILGIAQLGAAGYLGYKHIKKYGLFHQP